jgi:RND family efflux transporter MFP subunit
MKRYSRLLLVILVVAIVGGAGFWFYQTRLAPASASSAASGTYTQIVQVRQGPLSSTVSVVGELDAVQSETLAFTHMNGTAKLAKLNVAAGNTVKKGQALASIDPAPYQQALDQAKSDLQASQKTLADLQAPPTALEIATDDLAIAQANYDLENAKQSVTDLQAPDLASLKNALLDAQDSLQQAELNQSLAERDSLAKSERDLSYAADWSQRRITELLALKHPNLEQTERVITRTNKLAEFKSELTQVQTQRGLEKQSLEAAKAKAQAAIDVAQKALDTAQAGGAKLDVAKAQLDIQTAQVAIAKAQDDRTKLDQGADPSALATAQANVDRDQLAVSDAQTALDGAQLIADFDGTVLQTNVNVGDQVTSSTTVLTVANLKGLQVVASIDETTIKRVASGQTAQITFDAFPGQTFQGKVLSIPLQGSLQNDVMVYEVPVSLEGADQLSLLVGMTANVKVQVGEAKNALLVPSMALQKVNGLYQVLVADSNDPKAQPVSVPVEVGLSDGTYTQITKGLNVGDGVVVEMQSTTGQSNNRFGGGFNIPFGGGGVRPQGR